MTTYTIVRHPDDRGWTFDDGKPRTQSVLRKRKSWPSFLGLIGWLRLYRGTGWKVVIHTQQPLPTTNGG